MFLIRNLIFLIFYGICRATSQKETSVLVYHSVDSNGAYEAVNPKEFKKQLEHLRENYTIVSLDEIINFVEGKRNLPRKSVAITFDDGYYDNYSMAYPYLKRYDLPATVFVTAGYCQKEMLLDSVSLKMLGWNEIREMSQNGINIGAHTLTHPNLDEMSSEEIRNEILGSKEEIERRIGKNVDYFAYPFDRYNDKTVDLVKTLGFNGGFGGRGSIQQGANVFALNRIPVNSSVTFLMFKMQLTNAVDWITKIENIVRMVIDKFNACFGTRVRLPRLVKFRRNLTSHSG